MRFHCYFQDRGPEYAYLNDETGSNEGRYENSVDENITMEDSNTIGDHFSKKKNMLTDTRMSSSF